MRPSDGEAALPGLFTHSHTYFPDDPVAQAVVDRWNEVVAARQKQVVGSLGGLLAEMISAGVRAQASLHPHPDTPSMIPYTAKQLLQEDYDDDVREVQRTLTGRWRWGTEHEAVFAYGDEFWEVSYRYVTDDGIDWDTVGDPYQVWPKVVSKTIYVAAPPDVPVGAA